LLTACSDPAADKPKVTATEAVPIAAPATTGERHSISSDNSKIEFVGSKVTGSHNGSFQEFSGTIDYAGQPAKS